MYLGFDLETGGLDKKKHTITEAYFAIWDDRWVLIDELHLFMKNNNGEIIGEEEAFKITGIDPKKLLESSSTVTYDEGNKMLISMLEKHKIPGKRVHYKMLGQNVISFDVPFMQEQGFLSEQQMKKAGIHHNAIDTTVITAWLKDMDVLPNNVGSLSSLIEYFGLPKGTAHRAKDDVHMQKDVYIKLCEIFKKNAMANLTTSDNDLLKIVEL
jgi:DNA polymerase III epsilon subunit-like protein